MWRFPGLRGSDVDRSLEHGGPLAEHQPFRQVFDLLAAAAGVGGRAPTDNTIDTESVLYGANADLADVAGAG